MQFAPLAPAATFWHDAPHIENGRDMPDRLTGRYPDLGETLQAMDLEELRALAQDVIDECHARLPPEARDILSDEGVTPDMPPAATTRTSSMPPISTRWRM